MITPGLNVYFLIKIVTNMKKCPYCNAQIADESKFCGECGREYPNGKSCRYCGSVIHEGDVYCEHCGKKVGDADQTSADLKHPESNEVHTENVTSISEYEKEKTQKKYLPYIIAALVLLLIGCGWWYFSSLGQRAFTKEIRPTSTTFTEGELVEFIEIVDEPCQLYYTEAMSERDFPYIKLTVKLRLKKESPEIKNVNARNIILGWHCATIILLDDNNTEERRLKLEVETDELKLKKFLQGKKGDVESFVFERTSDQVPIWFEKAVAFAPWETGTYFGVSDNASNDEEFENDSNEGNLSSEDNESYNDYDMSTESDDYSTGRSGSEDWDVLLGTYEGYIDQIISETRKGTDNMDISNYTNLVEKAQKLSDKMEKAESDMSASQLTRFNKITLKLSQALQQMNE